MTNAEDQALDPIRCPYCQSTNWQCWDERSRSCEDDEGNYVTFQPYGCMRCLDCNRRFIAGCVDVPEGWECDDCDCS